MCLRIIVVLLTWVSGMESWAQKMGEGVPVEKDGKYSIHVGDQVLKIDPSKGGRITSLLLNGQDFLTDSTVNDFNWGSTFWLSPQLDWNWPPSAEIDNKPYQVKVVGERIRMTSLTDPKTGLAVTKEIFAKPGTGSFTIIYTITNKGEKARKAAPWEVTRVKTGGIAFFPLGKDQPRGGLLPSTMVENGIFWYVYQKDKLPVKGDRQIYADGAEGWLAQVNKDVVLIKKFKDVPLSLNAPKEGEVELFASELSAADIGYVEIEHQGAYEEIKPGGSLSWETTWILRRLPAGINPVAGDQGLVDYVRKTVK